MKNNLTQRGFIVPALVVIIALLVIGGGVYIYKNKKVEAPIVVNENEVTDINNEQVKDEDTPTETQLKKFVREKYSFYAPSEWIESSVILSGGNSSGCELYSINYHDSISYSGSDRTGGSINIYTKSCFVSLKLPSDAIKQNTEKAGYNIVAMYDSLTGTTPLEIIKTEEVYKKVVETFTLNQKTMSIKLYFPNRIINPQGDCSLVYPVDRTIPYTQAVATATLNELIKGPTAEEEKNGYFSSIPVGTKANSVNMVGNVLYIDFNEIAAGGGGSCGQTAKGSSIYKTLMQFPTVKSIQMTINGKGKAEDLFQP